MESSTPSSSSDFQTNSQGEKIKLNDLKRMLDNFDLSPPKRQKLNDGRMKNVAIDLDQKVQEKIITKLEHVYNINQRARQRPAWRV